MGIKWPNQDKNIPVPGMNTATTSPYKWGEMDIGDSVFFKGTREQCKPHEQSAHAFGSAKRKKFKEKTPKHLYDGWNIFKFTTRMVTEDGCLGMRIWRKS